MKTTDAIVRPLALAVLLALGFGALWASGTLWAVQIVRNLTFDEGAYENLYIQGDGTPVIMEYDPRFSERSVRTLDGVPVTQFNPVSAGMLAAPARDFQGLDWHQRLYNFSAGRQPPEFWYFLHDGAADGRGYFVGYDSKSKTVLGYLGAAGLRRDVPPAREQFPVAGRLLAADYGQFRGIAHLGQGFGFEPDADHGLGPEPPDTKTYLIVNDEVVEVNLTKGTVRPRFKAAGAVAVGETMRLLPDAAAQAGQAKKAALIVVRSEDRLILSDDAGVQRVTPLPEAVRREPLQAFELADGTVLVRVGRRGPEGHHDTLYWLSDDPAQARQRDVPLQQGGWRETPRSRASWLALGAPAPAALAVSTFLWEPLHAVETGRASDYGDGVAQSFAAAWPGLIVIALLAAVLAAWTWRWHRRQGGAAALLWAGLVLLGGLPGLVGYLCHRRWPARLACPSCGQETPGDRESCLACGRAFPAPAKLGTEVIA